jgi:hypothetical protein
MSSVVRQRAKESAVARVAAETAKEPAATVVKAAAPPDEDPLAPYENIVIYAILFISFATRYFAISEPRGASTLDLLHCLGGGRARPLGVGDARRELSFGACISTKT